MKCHYDVLGVSREAEETEIKNAYKKLALRWHPDKNLDSPVEAKEQFQLVQQAYEVLSDRQERAWYDNHREQILRGSNKDYKDAVILDVFPYFTTGCFSGYSDSDGGFYAVYSKVFETIAKEEMEYMGKEEFCEIPRFGNSQSDYETTVTAFYNFWLGYSTKRSYVWVDPYQVTADMRERRLLKLMEKENKKVRSKAKKERNEEVRNLVAFVRKRDKRVQAYSRVLEARAAENKLKQEEMAKQRRLARLKEIEETQIGDWMKLDNVQSELREIERSMAKEFGEELSEISDDDDCDEDDEHYSDDLFCIACSKLFKTSKAFENHEASRKHKEKMRFLKETMLKEESEMMKEDASENETEEIESDSKEIVTEDEEVKSEVEETKRKKNKRRNKKVLPVNQVEEKDESAIRLDVGTDDNADDKDFSVSKVKKKCKRQKKDQQAKTQQQLQKEKQVIEEKEEEAMPRVNRKKKQKRMNDATTKRAAAVATIVHEEGETIGGDDQQDKGHSCVSCKARFDSKNKLFEHLKRTGHSVHIQKEQSGGVLGKKSKKGQVAEHKMTMT